MSIKNPSFRLLTLAALLAALPAAAAPDSIIDLGTLQNNNEGRSSVAAINQNGSIIVGDAFNGTDNQAVVWQGGGFNRWQNKTNLGTLRSDNSGQSKALGISGNGTVIGGQAQNDTDTANDQYHAVIWHGSNWQDKTPLSEPVNTKHSGVWGISRNGTVAVGYSIDNGRGWQSAHVWSGPNYSVRTDLGSLRSRQSSIVAFAVSDDGAVVGGSTQQDGFGRDLRAVVWHGNNWQDKTPLGTLKSDNTGTSYVYALNGDGSIAAGWAESDTSTRRATIWSGTNWADKADLGTLKFDNSGISWVTGLSTDGHTAAGYAQDNNGNTRATVWRSSSWNDNSLLQKQDLGTLKADNSGNATVQVISGDGRIAAGASDSDSGYRRAVVWFIGRGRAVDIDNTHRSISTLSADTFSLLAARGNAVKSLLDGCRAEKGQYCYTAGYGYHNTTHDTRSHTAEFSLGYGFTDNFDAGFSLSVPAAHGRSGSYRLKTGMGLGLSARLRSTDGRWYVTPAVAFDSYKANVHRPHLNGTEETNNGARVKGRAYSLTLGQNFGTPESKSFGWYAALRRTEAKRTAYQEDESLSFPFAYGEARLKDTALAVGTEGSLQLTDKLAWQGGLEVEQRLGGSETRFTASANHLGDYAEAHKPTGFRPNIRTALTYAFSPEAKLSLGGYLGRSAFTGTDKGVYLRLHGKF